MLFSKLCSLFLAVAPALATSTNATRTIFQYRNNGTWLEKIAVRGNGNILTTRLDVPELWRVDPTGTHNAFLIHTFPNARSLLGITEIQKDIYAVVAGNFSLATVSSTPGSYTLWKVDLSTPKPHVSLITKVPGADFLNGLTLFNNDTLLATDSAKGVIWRISLSNGTYSIPLSESSTMLSSKDSPKPVGVNGIKVLGRYVYYTSTSQIVFACVPFTEDAVPAGPVEIIASEFTPDDFVLTRNGTAMVTLVAGNLFSLGLAGATSVALSRDQKALYVATAGGQFQPVVGDIIEPAKIVEVRI